MSVRKVRALVPCGDGLSGAPEMAEALRLAGFSPELLSLNELHHERVDTNTLCSKWPLLAFPGGASFADQLGAGRLAALKIQQLLGWDLAAFSARGGMVLGAGNGFQILIHLGVFGRDVSLAQNEDGKMIDTWVRVIPSGNQCVWLRGAGAMELPLRCSEGRVVFGVQRRTEVLGKMARSGMMCLRYEGNPNGSDELLAGLCDPSGRIFGLMPHPELFLRWTAHPEWTLQPGRANSPGQGLAIFENAFRAIQEAR